MAEQQALVEIRNLSKGYPGVQALDDVDFTLLKGETHVLVGENGAGKTTLVKVLCGATTPDSFEKFEFDGKPTEIRKPRDAMDLGITAIQQHFSLVPHMTVAENIFLGREFATPLRPVDRDGMEREAKILLEQMGVDIDPQMPLYRLDMSHQQVVEIVKAFSQKPKLLVMDEPTSGLTRDETVRLFEMIRKIQDQGISILYISHRLEEVFEIGDRITVLRNGKKVEETKLSETTHAGLSQAIIGREVSRRYPKEEITAGEVLFSVRNLQNAETTPTLRDISFDVRAGEIVAFYGILGCGKDELADTLFGRKPATDGTLLMDDSEITVNDPKDAIRNRIGYLTADRHEDGIVEMMTLRQNLTLAALEERFARFGAINEEEETKVAQEYMKDLQLHAPHPGVLVRNLSGGNQQKVVFGKWLLANARILILNEPTKGVDVGSKVHLFELMTRAAKEGAGVILMTAEAEEAVEMGDTIIVMRNGRIAGEYGRKDVVEKKVTLDEVLRVATTKEREGVGST